MRQIDDFIKHVSSILCRGRKLCLTSGEESLGQNRQGPEGTRVTVPSQANVLTFFVFPVCFV
jgi:hypothetical protein